MNNSAFTIQQQEILKILGNSDLDLDVEMGKIFNSKDTSDVDGGEENHEHNVRFKMLFKFVRI
jgi:hypothetical protein